MIYYCNQLKQIRTTSPQRNTASMLVETYKDTVSFILYNQGHCAQSNRGRTVEGEVYRIRIDQYPLSLEVQYLSYLHGEDSKRITLHRLQ